MWPIGFLIRQMSEAQIHRGEKPKDAISSFSTQRKSYEK